MITGEPRWARIIDIHPYWVSPRYFDYIRQKIADLDQHNAKSKAARDAKKAEAS